MTKRYVSAAPSLSLEELANVTGGTNKHKNKDKKVARPGVPRPYFPPRGPGVPRRPIIVPIYRPL